MLFRSASGSMSEQEYHHRYGRYEGQPPLYRSESEYGGSIYSRERGPAAGIHMDETGSREEVRKTNAGMANGILPPLRSSPSGFPPPSQPPVGESSRREFYDKRPTSRNSNFHQSPTQIGSHLHIDSTTRLARPITHSPTNQTDSSSSYKLPPLGLPNRSPKQQEEP